MDTRRRPAAEAASWRNVAYPTGADVVDPVFNQIRRVLSVCPLSVVAVRVVVRESVAMYVRLDPQHAQTHTKHAFSPCQTELSRSSQIDTCGIRTILQLLVCECKKERHNDDVIIKVWALPHPPFLPLEPLLLPAAYPYIYSHSRSSV